MSLTDDICVARFFVHIIINIMAVTSYIARYAEFLNMWDQEKAIPRKMHIHMSTMGYRDEESILDSLAFF